MDGSLWKSILLFLCVGLAVYSIINLKQRAVKIGVWKDGEDDPILTPDMYRKAGADIPPKKAGEKRIVWVMISYLPNVRAGSELTAEDQIAFLQKKGWTIYVLVTRWVVPEHRGVKIYPIQAGRVFDSPHIEALYKSADLICLQNYSLSDFSLQVSHIPRPIVVFIHSHHDNKDILNFRMETPIYVVYNVNFIKLESANLHPSIVIHPKVETAPFRVSKKNAKYVTLINCNDNKGGAILIKLAEALPDIQFLGIKGGYSGQIIADPRPPNLTYMETQTDMRNVYEKTKVLIVPSKTETWGRVAVEGMASGTPVVVSRSPGLLECVGKSENSCDRADISCWIDKINKLMTDEKAYAEASALSKERVAELDTEKEYERLNTFLEDAAKRHMDKE